MLNIPTDLLRTLVTVVDLRSFTKAAQALGVPTLNGYTGGLPPGAHLTMSCPNALTMLNAYDKWAPKHRSPSGR